MGFRLRVVENVCGWGSKTLLTHVTESSDRDVLFSSLVIVYISVLFERELEGRIAPFWYPQPEPSPACLSAVTRPEAILGLEEHLRKFQALCAPLIWVLVI